MASTRRFDARPRTPRRSVAVLIALGLAAGSVAVSAPVRAEATVTVADWRMDEPSGATVMQDASGNGIHGAIGSAVRTGVVVAGATAYRWTHTQPNQPPPKPERLIVADDDRLNPGSDDYAITIRFRTTRNFGNMIQKGQSKTPGGYFKWQIPRGKLQCLFRGIGPDGSIQQKGVGSGTTLLNDGAWHVVRCERTTTAVTMTIDGTITRRNPGPSGSIDNDVPLAIGGKLNCDQENITCDYFVGDIDWVRIERGSSSEPPPPPPPPPGSTVFDDDFSSGDFSAWTNVNGLSIDGSQGSSQPPSARGAPNGSRAFAYRTLDDSFSSGCFGVSVNAATLGGSAVDLFRLRTSAGGPIVKVFVRPGGDLRIRNDAAGVQRGSGATLGPGWRRVRLCGATGPSGAWDLALDGQTIVESWQTNTGATAIGRVQIGDSKTKTWTVSFDDVAFDATTD